MTYLCRLCKKELDESSFPHENGKVRRYICWTCGGRPTEKQLVALSAGRHLGPEALRGVHRDMSKAREALAEKREFSRETDIAKLLGLTDEQFAQLKEITKGEKTT